MSCRMWCCNGAGSVIPISATLLPGCCIGLAATVTRELTNQGFHRDLVTSLSIPSSPGLADCRLLVVERLPAGVYVDPYQLSRLQDNGRHGNRYRVTGRVNIEAMAENSDWLKVLVWTQLNNTEPGEMSLAWATLPLHARYQRASETERTAAVYIDPPEVYLGCDWDSADGCPCAVTSLPCRAAGGATCNYQPVSLSNSPMPVLSVPLGDLRDLELVTVGTTAAVVSGCALLLLVTLNKRLPG